MIKRSVLVLIVIIICLNFTSCYVRDAQVIAEYYIPFTETTCMLCDTELVEADEYGRTLYSIRSCDEINYNVFSDFVENESDSMYVLVYLIVQKTDDAFVYCYEECSYIFVSTLNDNREILKKFKADNDWNKRLNKNKMAKLSANIDGINDYADNESGREDEIVLSLGEQLGLTIGDHHYFDVIFSAKAEPIYIVRLVDRWFENGEPIIFGKAYVFICDKDYEIVEYAELEGTVDTWPAQIYSFKKDCGLIYKNHNGEPQTQKAVV